MRYDVYILTNRYCTVLYTGVTNDLIRRVYEHRSHADKDGFTSRYNVTRLVYFEETSDVRAAIEREKQIKSWNRDKKTSLIMGMNPNWQDLYPKQRFLKRKIVPGDCHVAALLAMTCIFEIFSDYLTQHFCKTGVHLCLTKRK